MARLRRSDPGTQGPRDPGTGVSLPLGVLLTFTKIGERPASPARVRGKGARGPALQQAHPGEKSLLSELNLGRFSEPD